MIRETTSINNHTYRFAPKAWAEGMPVIDDPISMMRCTNKVYLWELLRRRPAGARDHDHPGQDGNLEEVGGPAELSGRAEDPGRRRSRAASGRPTNMAGAEQIVASSSSKAPTSASRRNSCRPSSTGASACSTGGRCSSASTRWRAATGRSSTTAGRRADRGRPRTIAVEDAPQEVVDDRRARGQPDRRRPLRRRPQAGPDGTVYVIEINDNPNLDTGRGPGAERRSLPHHHQRFHPKDRSPMTSPGCHSFAAAGAAGLCPRCCRRHRRHHHAGDR